MPIDLGTETGTFVGSIGVSTCFEFPDSSSPLCNDKFVRLAGEEGNSIPIDLGTESGVFVGSFIVSPRLDVSNLLCSCTAGGEFSCCNVDELWSILSLMNGVVLLRSSEEALNCLSSKFSSLPVSLEPRTVNGGGKRLR